MSSSYRVFEIKKNSLVKWTGDFMKFTGLNKYSQVNIRLSNKRNKTPLNKTNQFIQN